MSFFDFLHPDVLAFGEKYDSAKATQYMKDINMPKPKWSIGKMPDIVRATRDLAKLEWKHQCLKKKNKKVSFGFVSLFILFAIGFVFLALWLSFAASDSGAFIGFLIMFPIAVVFLVAKRSRGVMVDAVKYSLAKENGWTYDPTPSKQEAKVLFQKYPHIFRGKTNDHPEVDDQLWGAFNFNGKIRHFHSGLYSYITGGKNSTTVLIYFFALKLDKKIKHSFTLVPEYKVTGIEKSFSGKELKLESIEFNKKFAFKYKESRDKIAPIATKCLSPAVQNLIVDLQKKHSNLYVCFSDDALIFSTNSMVDLTEYGYKSNKKMSDWKFDKHTYGAYISNMNKIATEIANKLD